MIEINEIVVMIVAKSSSTTNKLKSLIDHHGMNVIIEEEKNMITSLQHHKPDILLLDVSFIKKEEDLINEIVIVLNIPLIIISSETVHDTAKTVYAITNGASDFILEEKLTLPCYKEEVIRKMENITSSLPLTNKLKRKKTIKQIINSGREENKHKMLEKRKERKPFEQIVAIGTSTGGPKALQIVLSKLPKNFPAPIVIVQHMPSGFTKSLANRLNNLSQIHVKEAIDGEKLQPGTAYIAPGNYHMVINEQLKVSIYQGRERDGHRPSVNILFESIAKLKNIKKTAVILTGMGKDGAYGVKKMIENDETTTVIVESEETAIINGMPKATLKTGYVTDIVRLESIGDTLIHYIMRRGN